MSSIRQFLTKGPTKQDDTSHRVESGPATKFKTKPTNNNTNFNNNKSLDGSKMTKNELSKYDFTEDDDDEVIIIESRPATLKSLLHVRDQSQTSSPLSRQKSTTVPKNGLSPMQSKVAQKRPLQSIVKTPNVPRTRGSFFNRKFKEFTSNQETPTTPKLDRSKAISQRNRIRSGGADPYGSYSSERNKSSNKSSRVKQPQNNYLDSDFSTPKTTRTLLSSTTVSGGRMRDSKIPQLIYRPLELDNESSSESSDSLMRYRNKIRRLSQESPNTPLAIEGPKMSPASFRPDTPQCQDQKAVESSQEQSLEAKVNKDDNIVKQEPNVGQIGAPTNQQRTRQAPEIDKLSQCITPPITPESNRAKAELSLAKLPTFIPGSCNIDEVLKLHGSNSKDSNNK